MISESFQVEVSGRELHRMVMSPDEGAAVRAVMMCYHGQGDYAERYLVIFDVFTKRGIRCVMTELPGHGESEGRRGHCGDEALLDAVIENTLREYVAPESLPYGVMGHSMGGLLAARHMVLAGQGVLPEPSFVWLSSALVSPAYGRAESFIRVVRMLGRMFPFLTISTKVKPSDCCIRRDSEPIVKVSKKHQLWHSRVSLGWGAELIRFADFVRQNLSAVAVDLPILMTQGSADHVCPAELACEFYEAVPSVKKKYLELEGMLHEPFKGEGSEKLFDGLELWLDGLELQ